MKFNKHKVVGLLCAVFLVSSTYAQKHDKKYNESFKVNKDVKLVINATNADINVSTWNRNEVSVDAKITVEGLPKKEAQKFIKNWKFEALGNRNKVEINANGNGFMDFGDFDFNFEMPEIDFEMPEIDFEMPEIDFEMPEINLDFEEILSEIDDYDFEDGDNNTFTFKSKGKDKTVVIKSRKEWEKFKKSSDYKDMKLDLEKKLKKAQTKINKIDKKKIEEQIKKAKIRFEKVDRVKIKAQLAKAKVALEKMKVKMKNSHKNGNYIFEIKSGKDNKKVKITRTITIKVPKDATYKLNTRHSKVKLPKGKATGKVSYGAFTADEVNGGDLKIYYAPVVIKTLSQSIVSLNNVTDAKLASVSNTKLTSNSSDLTIDKLHSNVVINAMFGELTIEEFLSSLENFKLRLNFSEATLNAGKAPINFKKYSKNGVIAKNGNFEFSSGPFEIHGKQSELTIHQ